MNETLETLEQHRVACLSALTSAVTACVETMGKIDALEAKRPAVDVTVQRRTEAEATLSAAERARDDELGTAVLDDRKPNLAAAEKTIHNARVVLDAIDKESVAAFAASRLIDAMTIDLRTALPQQEEARNSALAFYIYGLHSLQRKRCNHAADALRVAENALDVILEVATTVGSRFVKNQSFQDGDWDQSMLRNCVNEMRAKIPVTGAVPPSDVRDSFWAPLEALGICRWAQSQAAEPIQPASTFANNAPVVVVTFPNTPEQSEVSITYADSNGSGTVDYRAEATSLRSH